MNKISELYTEIYDDRSTKDPKKLIKIVEPYADHLMKNDFENYDERYKATRLIADYSIGLTNSGFMKKALPFLNQAIELFKSDAKLSGKDLLDEPLYESLIFIRGETYYNLKKFSEATKNFKLLVAKWPDNDRYKGWYNASVSYQLKQIEWIFILMIVLFLVLDLSINHKQPFFYYGYLFPIIGFITIVIIRISRRIK